jgi:hypothetical protein
MDSRFRGNDDREHFAAMTIVSITEIGDSFGKTRVIPAKAGIHFDLSKANGFPLSRE